jgi:homopolymeric O-antigen transport system permease protein
VTHPASYAKGPPIITQNHEIPQLNAGMTTAARPTKITRTVRITAEAVPKQAFADLLDGVRLYELWTRLAFHDIRQRFQRSVLGPFWLTLSMGVMVGTLGFVFSTLFQQDAAKTLPYIATGIIFWGLLTGCIIDGTIVFIAAEAFIRNVPMPLSVHFYRLIARNVIIWMFNMAIYLVMAIYFMLAPDWNTLLFIPGFILFLINVGWMALVAGVLSTRYRDIPQIITNLIQIVFFLTPIFWSPANLPNRPAFVTLNPFYHLIEIVRAPLLGEPVSLASWQLCIGLALAGVGFTAWLYRRAHARIAYWV